MKNTGHWPEIVFWIGIPLVLACARLLTVPESGALAPLPLAFNFSMILLGWVVFHLSTLATLRFLTTRSWRADRASVAHGLYVLSIGGLMGSILLFPTRPLRAQLYLQLGLDSEIEWHATALSRLTWEYSGDFWRLSVLNLMYWVFANQLVAWIFSVPRYGFAMHRAGLGTESTIESPNDAKHSVNEAVSPLLSKLPLELGNDPILLVANEHYLDVHTRTGHALVLYRLSDAARELGERGVRVHRSFWVALDAIREIRKEGAAMHVVLENGMTAPVSRSNRHLFSTGKFQRMQLR